VQEYVGDGGEAEVGDAEEGAQAQNELPNDDLASLAALQQHEQDPNAGMFYTVSFFL
jgi:hypothetical protein